MSNEDLYLGREQTLVKHFILRRYLERFAHIIGFRWDAITYVDCFSGPWKSQSGELKDTSFVIALEELRKARATHRAIGKELGLRCMFLERDAKAYTKLKEFADKVTDITVETRNSDLTGAIGDVLHFVNQGGASSFPFFFIDPTGWTGFEMDLIAPLLRQKPGEVLINFMTDFIRRFIDHPDQQTREQLVSLFGSDSARIAMESLTDPRDREDVLLKTYGETVQARGGFSHVCRAIVLYPEIDRSYFHLIYATRNRKGVEKFKEVELQAMEVQEQQRAEAKQRKRTKKTSQKGLFPALEMPHTETIEALRGRYLEQAKKGVHDLLQTGRPVPFENVWDLALSYPLVWDGDVKDWLRDWRAARLLKIEGMRPRQRVPKLGENNRLVWQKPAG